MKTVVPWFHHVPEGSPIHRLRILHLSDLHERASREREPWRRQRVLGAPWIKNLQILVEGCSVDLVCFTGDAADWGLPEEYKRATEFFQEVLDVLGLSWERFYAVPGNHDVQRETREDVWQRVRRKVLRSDDLDVFRWLDGRGDLLDADDREHHFERFNSYRAWLRDVGRGALAVFPGYRETVRLPDRPFDVHVVGLDSAWLCGDDNDSGKLRLTDGQIGRLTSDDDGNVLPGLRLALVHHPLTDLADSTAARRLLAERTDLVLRGHLHALELGRQLDPDGRDLHELAAGCLYEGDRADHHANGCTLLELHLDDDGRPRSCDVWLRSWSPAGHWHDDDSRYAGSQGGRLTLSFSGPRPRDVVDMDTKSHDLRGRLVSRPRIGNPYRGLDAFRPEDAGVFFGRDLESDELVRRVCDGQGRIVAVIGPSGSGKSSLVSAGLLPRLAAGAVPKSTQWVSIRFTPAEAGDNPFRALALRLNPLLARLNLSPTELAKRMRLNPEGAIRFPEIALAGRPAPAELLLFADQFEELFTRVAEMYREPFVLMLDALTKSHRARLILTLRADYYEHCTRYDILTAHLRTGSFPLGIPNERALVEIIKRPADTVELDMESKLVDRILLDSDSDKEPGALPLVEFTLERLYEARLDGALTLEVYEALNGIGGAIEAQGERAVQDGQGFVDERTVSNVFRALTDVDEIGRAVRRPALLQRLGEQDRATVSRLLDARLLVSDSDPDGQAIVELAHDAVLLHWPRLRRWLTNNHDLIVWRRRVSAPG